MLQSQQAPDPKVKPHMRKSQHVFAEVFHVLMVETYGKFAVHYILLQRKRDGY